MSLTSTRSISPALRLRRRLPVYDCSSSWRLGLHLAYRQWDQVLEKHKITLFNYDAIFKVRI